MKKSPAYLLLSNGSIYQGSSFGSATDVDGEVVFATGMVGYPESLTDPSYRGQILTFTYPLIGNYGIPKTGFESNHIQARAVVVQQYEDEYSHWQATKSLHTWLEKEGIPGITGIDTRALTKELRTHGVLAGRIIQGDANALTEAKKQKLIKAIVDPNSTNLVAEVSVKKPVIYRAGKKQILLVDCGVKQSIIDNFVDRGITVKRVPWDYDFTGELEEFDGLFISNGPGDPKQCKATIKHVEAALKTNIPQFGICLGSQIQGLASGAKTYKLKFGHRGQNQACVIEGSQRAILTSQNHGYAVKESSVPKEWEVLFRNVNDNSVEGLYHKTKPFFSVQFHPEAAPGPSDANYLFDKFIELIKTNA